MWRLHGLILLFFAACLVSLLLRGLADPVRRWTRLGSGLSLGLVVLGTLVLALLVGGFLGWRIEAQISEVTDLLPASFRVFLEWVGSNPLGARVLDGLDQLRLGAALPALLQLPGYALAAGTIAGDVLLVIAGGTYLAAQPELYRGALERLTPAVLRPRIAAITEEIAGLLRKWLFAQLIAMVSVGLLVGLGMWAIGAPDPAALGLFAGIAEFLPFIGPVISAVPALLLALLHGVDQAVWTLVLFIVVQQFEGNLLLPLIQRRIMRLPPVLTLFALVGFGSLFGLLGVLLAIPLTLVSMVLIKRFYLREPLGSDEEDP